jgi:hypothetical protein
MFAVYGDTFTLGKAIELLYFSKPGINHYQIAIAQINKTDISYTIMLSRVMVNGQLTPLN